MKFGRIALLAFGLTVFGLAAPAWAQEASVSIVDNEYDPDNIEVEPGTTVTWTNNGDIPHTVTADNGSFESGNLDPGDTFEQEFTEAGTYSYYCEYHGDPDGEGMSGVVTVSGGDDADDPTDPPDDNGNGDDTTDDPLPQTGADIWAFVYLGAVFIGAGAVFLRLQRA